MKTVKRVDEAAKPAPKAEPGKPQYPLGIKDGKIVDANGRRVIKNGDKYVLAEAGSIINPLGYNKEDLPYLRNELLPKAEKKASAYDPFRKSGIRVSRNMQEQIDRADRYVAQIKSEIERLSGGVSGGHRF